MRPQLKRSDTWKRFSLTRKDSIRITETQPVRWQPLGVQRSLYDDFSHRLFEWGWKDVFLFVSAAYLAVILAFALLLYLSVSTHCTDRQYPKRTRSNLRLSLCTPAGMWQQRQLSIG